MSRFHLVLAAASVATLSVGTSAFAVLQAVSLPGNTQHDLWYDGGFSSSKYSGYGSFPGSTPWPAPIASNGPGTGDATVNRTAGGSTGGGPYLASGSIYSGSFTVPTNGFGGSLVVADATPVAGLQNVVYQIDVGGLFGYDFYNNALPVLSFNGGSQAIAPTVSYLVDHIDTGTVSPDGSGTPVFRDTYLLQWDLSGVASPITGYSIAFSTVQHSQVYAMSLDQSSAFAPVAVPEPTVALAGLPATAALLGRRRRR